MTHHTLTSATAKAVHADAVKRQAAWHELEAIHGTPDASWSLGRCQSPLCAGTSLYVWPRGTASLEHHAAIRCPRCGGILQRTSRMARGVWRILPLTYLEATYAKALERLAEDDARAKARHEQEMTGRSEEAKSYAWSLHVTSHAKRVEPVRRTLRKLRKMVVMQEREATYAASAAEANAKRNALAEEATVDAGVLDILAGSGTPMAPLGEGWNAKAEATEPEAVQEATTEPLTASEAKAEATATALDIAEHAAACQRLLAAMLAAWCGQCYGLASEMPRTPESVLATLDARTLQTGGHGRRARQLAAREELVAAMRQEAEAVANLEGLTEHRAAKVEASPYVLEDTPTGPALVPATLAAPATMAEGDGVRELGSVDVEAAYAAAREQLEREEAKVAALYAGNVDGSTHEALEAKRTAAIRAKCEAEDVARTLRAALPPAVHYFGSTGEAYDASQRDDDIADGDVLVVRSEGAVAVLVSAWPTARTERLAGESFHVLAPGSDPAKLEASAVTGRTDWSASFALADSEAAKLYTAEEAAVLAVLDTEPAKPSEAVSVAPVAEASTLDVAPDPFDDDATLCRSCGHRADWHDACDMACPDDDGPHPGSIAADGEEDSQKNIIVTTTYVMNPERTAKARPDSCPDCGASARSHTGPYCHECGTTLVEGRSTRPVDASTKLRRAERTRLYCSQPEPSEEATALLEDISRVMLDWHELGQGERSTDAAEAQARVAKEATDKLAALEPATYALVPEHTLLVLGMPYVERQHSGTEDGWLYYVLQDGQRVEDAGGCLEASHAWLEAADLARLGTLGSVEREAVESLRSSMCGEPEDTYGVALLDYATTSTDSRSHPEGHALQAVEYRLGRASQGWTPEAIRLQALADGVPVLVDVEGRVWTAEDGMRDAAAKLVEAEAEAVKLREATAKLAAAENASRVLPDMTNGTTGHLVVNPGAVLPDTGAVVVAASASRAHVWTVLAMRTGWHAADGYYVATFARPSACSHTDMLPGSLRWHDGLGSAVRDYCDRTGHTLPEGN